MHYLFLFTFYNILMCVTTLRMPPYKPNIDRRSVSRIIGLGCLSPLIKWPASVMSMEDQLKYFPGARSCSDIDKRVSDVLYSRGYTMENTLFGLSVCSDEVNFADKELITMIKKRWGEPFSLGGLGGIPFAGKTGFRAFAHHVPDNGRLFVLFAPHVGIGLNGEEGVLKRQGISKPSSACGAVVGAYNDLLNSENDRQPGSDFDNFQFDYIKYKLKHKCYDCLP